MDNTLIGKLTPTNNMGGTLTNESRLTGQLGGVGAAVTYASLPDKPSINNVELVGNKTTSDLNISYNDLRDQPVIPDVGEIDERLDDLEGDITSLSGRVTTAEGDITSLGGRLTTAEGDITSLSGRVTTAEGNITSLGGRVTTAEGNITTLQGDTGALDTRLTTAEGDITSLSGRVTTAEGDITSLGGRVTTAEGDITSLGGRVTTAEGNITTLQGDMSQAQSDISQLNSSLNVIGNFYTIGWTATSSNANDVQLTTKTNLSRGTYIAIGSAPVPSVKDFPISLACSGAYSIVPYFNGIRDRSVIAFIIQINDNTTDVWLKTASSHNCTYNNIDQSFIRFIRIS